MQVTSRSSKMGFPWSAIHSFNLSNLYKHISVDCDVYTGDSEKGGSRHYTVLVRSDTGIVGPVAFTYIADRQRPVASFVIVLQQPHSRAGSDRYAVL